MPRLRVIGPPSSIAPRSPVVQASFASPENRDREQHTLPTDTTADIVTCIATLLAREWNIGAFRTSARIRTYCGMLSTKHLRN